MPDRREFDKRCTKCGVFYPFSMFSPRKIAADGLNSWCRNCRASDNKQRSRRNSKPVVEDYEAGNIFPSIANAVHARRSAARRK